VDFINLVRYQKDKSNGNVDLKWCDKFNKWINKNCLIEIKLLERCFTWTNNQDCPILSHIDRVFCSTKFETHFPMALARAFPRNPSDHVPVMWESGCDQKSIKTYLKLRSGGFNIRSLETW
jgi:hypothetical protein